MQRLLENTRRHDLTFHRNGVIRITARVVRILQIQPGDCINIALNDGEYLLFASRYDMGKHEAQCYPSKKGSGNFCANSVHLCRSLFSSVGITRDKVSFMIGEKIEISGTTYLPIITKHPL